MEIQTNQLYEMKNVISYRAKMTQQEVNDVMNKVINNRPHLIPPFSFFMKLCYYPNIQISMCKTCEIVSSFSYEIRQFPP